MDDLSMFQRPRTVALEDEKPGTYGMVSIYPLHRLVKCGSAGYVTTIYNWGNPGLTLLRRLGRSAHQNGAVVGKLNMCASFDLDLELERTLRRARQVRMRIEFENSLYS
ncbi:hypothetical protein PIB30_039603 [Stylosanthes scabra]|uniref:Uncharacterized protein n=1 Tax=Stylosanthes scabra TaxID=79078 RepID=A0ABU6ZD25_9FABA|nr:hypothetical protein [Stylosanthes scabra]